MAEQVRALIVDDEPPAREALAELLESFPGIDVVGQAENGYEAVRMVHELHPDLLLLDIQMPRLDGFDVIELLGPDTPNVIFVTAYDEYALRAFEKQVVDYLLKPVSRGRLDAALERIIPVSDAVKDIGALSRSHKEAGAPLERVLIRDGAEVFVIPCDEIMYIEAQDDYVEVHTQKESHLKYERMSSLTELLDPQFFCRIHRSYILNISFLEKIEPYSKDSKVAILKNGKTLPISRTGHAKLMELF